MHITLSKGYLYFQDTFCATGFHRYDRPHLCNLVNLSGFFFVHNRIRAAVTIFAYATAVISLRLKNNKINSAAFTLIGLCFIGIGLWQGIWGSQNTMIIALLLIGGICECLAGIFIFFNIGPNRTIRNV